MDGTSAHNPFKVDLHVHSIFSWDSSNKPDQLIKVARKKGLAGIAVTDHDTIRGGVITSSLSPKGFYVIIGSEIKTDIGEITGLFITEEIKCGDPFEVVDEIKSQGGIAVLPHPFRAHEILSKEIIDKINAIEVFNGRCTRSENDRAKQLALDYNKPVVGGSDAHTLSQIGHGLVELKDISNIDDIRKAILTGNLQIIEKYPSIGVKIYDIANQIKSMPGWKKREFVSHPRKTLGIIKKKIK